MLDFATSVGLDVHARSIKAVAINVMTGETKARTFGCDPASVAEWAWGLEQPARCVCESGATGFHLQRSLEAAGVPRVVGAVSGMTRPAADRGRKTDRRDAEFLARMPPVGSIVPVWVPDEGREAARDLSRALEDAREDLARARQRLSKLPLRHGRVLDERTPTGRRKGTWTGARWGRIGPVETAEPASREATARCVDEVRRAAEAKAALERAVAGEAARPRWKARVDAMRRLKLVSC